MTLLIVVPFSAVVHYPYPLESMARLRSVSQISSQIRFTPEASLSFAVKLAVNAIYHYAMIIRSSSGSLGNSVLYRHNLNILRHESKHRKEICPQRQFLVARSRLDSHKSVRNQILGSEGLTRARRSTLSVAEKSKSCKAYQQQICCASAAEAAANLQGRPDVAQGDVC